MGINLSTLNYTLELKKYREESLLCCPLFIKYESLFLEKDGIYLFKSKKLDNWLYYSGIISDLYQESFINVSINEDLLIEKSKKFNNLYELINYDKLDKELLIELLKYQKENIKTNYLDLV